MLFKKKKESIRRDIHGRPIIEDDKKNKKKKDETITENRTISNIVAPMGITFNRNSIKIGDNLARAYGIIRYPQYADYAWLRRLTNIHGTVATIQFTPLDTVSVLKNLNNSIRNYRIDAMDQKDPLQRQRAEQSVTNAEEAMRRIDQNGEIVGAMSMVIIPLAENDRDFEKLCRLTENSAMIANCKARKMANEQKESIQFAWPTYTERNNINKQLERLMPISSLVGGFPFAASGFNDRSGFYRGHDGLGGAVYVDSWIRREDRSNSNYIIAGDSGQGKSATIKSMAIMEYVLGASIFFIDPEGEYRELTDNLGGEWLNASGGNGKVINPLQILKLPKEDDEDALAEGDNYSNDLERHLKTLEVFIKLYLKDITQQQMALLKMVIEQVYKQFRIDWDTDVAQLKNTDFPTFKDVYSYLLKAEENAENKGQRDFAKEYHHLSMLLRDIAIGSDSFLWGNPTTLELNKKMVCIDTSGLNASPDNIKSAQYFLLQNYVWQKATRSNQEKSIIVYDEAHMIIDKQVPQPMKTLSQQERRARKYEAAIWVASQQINDFIDPEIKFYGQAILDQPTYKIILGMSGQGLIDLSNLYHLKDTEKDLVEQKTRGRGLFMIGSKRIDLSIKIDEFKLKYFNQSGGR